MSEWCLNAWQGDGKKYETEETVCDLAQRLADSLGVETEARWDSDFQCWRLFSAMYGPEYTPDRQPQPMDYFLADMSTQAAAQSKYQRERDGIEEKTPTQTLFKFQPQNGVDIEKIKRDHYEKWVRR